MAGVCRHDFNFRKLKHSFRDLAAIDRLSLADLTKVRRANETLKQSQSDRIAITTRKIRPSRRNQTGEAYVPGRLPTETVGTVAENQACSSKNAPVGRTGASNRGSVQYDQ